MFSSYFHYFLSYGQIWVWGSREGRRGRPSLTLSCPPLTLYLRLSCPLLPASANQPNLPPALEFQVTSCSRNVSAQQFHVPLICSSSGVRITHLLTTWRCRWVTHSLLLGSYFLSSLVHPKLFWGLRLHMVAALFWWMLTIRFWCADLKGEKCAIRRRENREAQKSAVLLICS